MNLLAFTQDSASPALFRLFIVASVGYLVVQLIFRQLKGGAFPALRAATGFVIATALYCGGLAFIFPSVPVLDSFDRPDSIGDVKDPQKLLRLLQAQHSAVVHSIEIQERTTNYLFLASMCAGINGLVFLWRMRANQREAEYFADRRNVASEDQTEVT